jgi:SagB-type dehydrogenase family enzyme
MSADRGAGERYHRETRYAASGGVHLPPEKAGETERLIELPPPAWLPTSGQAREGDVGLGEALAARRSVRRYGNEPVSLDELSQLLWAAGGETGRAEAGFRFRTTPSAGGLYPVDTCAACRAVEGVEAGVWRYEARRHALGLVREGDVSEGLAEAALGQAMVARAAVTLVWTAVVGRTTGKYGPRGYRYIYMEAGIASENVHLAATALGLGSCAVGAFCDDAVEAILGADGREEIALLLQCVGRPATT